MATELCDTDFFENVAGIIPVPLSKQRMAKRGYNQSELLARGVSAITGLPIVTDILVRKVDNPSQTTLAPTERKSQCRRHLCGATSRTVARQVLDYPR